MIHEIDIERNVECPHCHGHSFDIGLTNRSDTWRCLCNECREMFIVQFKKGGYKVI